MWLVMMGRFSKIADSVSVPVIASGGAGTLSHIAECFSQCNVDAIAIAHLLHYDKMSISEIKKGLIEEDIEVSLRHEE